VATFAIYQQTQLSPMEHTHTLGNLLT